MAVDVPAHIVSRPIGTLFVSVSSVRADFFIREEPVRVARLPRPCAVELRLPAWNRPPVLLTALLVRLGHSDLCTYETGINGAEPASVRIFQALERQDAIEIHLASDRVIRTFRVPNTLADGAAALVRELRNRPAWAAAQFQLEREKLNRLYPTPHGLWWGCAEATVESATASATKPVASR